MHALMLDAPAASTAPLRARVMAALDANHGGCGGRTARELCELLGVDAQAMQHTLANAVRSGALEHRSTRRAHCARAVAMYWPASQAPAKPVAEPKPLVAVQHCWRWGVPA